MELNIIERSHSVWIDVSNSVVKSYVWKFLYTITSKKILNERGTKREVYDQCYATKTPCGKYVGMLKPAFKRLVDDLAFSYGIYPTITRDMQNPPSGKKVEYKIKKGVTFKDEEQEEAYTHLEKDLPMHILECATGFGKTFLGLYSSAMRQKKTIFLMQAGHIATWLKDIEKFIDIEKTDVGVIQGRDSFISATKLAKEDKYTPNFIFMSLETLREFIKGYEAGEAYLDITPFEITEVFDVGRIVRDESHEAPYSFVKQTLYLNVKELLCLSATIVSENNFIAHMYEDVFPKAYRWKSKNNTHIEVYSVRYTHDLALRIRTSTGFGYSHLRYEKDLLKKPYLRKQYYDMVREVAYNFELDYEPGMKMLIFCGLTDMCEYLTQNLKAAFHDLKVATYVASTKEEVLKESDIIVTTMGSCGTGKDIEDLAHVYNTVAVNSKKKAWQAMGRLRPLKNYKGKSTKYYFFSNMNIPAHRKYENIRRIDLVDKSKFIKVINLGCTIRAYSR